MRWRWESSDTRWQVTLDAERGVLAWHGEDKPRPGVRDQDLAAGGKDQTLDDLLERERGAYPCPPDVLAQIIAAARRVKAREAAP